MREGLRKLIKKPEMVFLVIASFFGIASMALMPILQAPDENQHFQISYAVFSSNKAAGDDIVLNEEITLNYVRDGHYGDVFTNKTSADDDGISINTGSYVFDGKTRASIFDIKHLVQALGVLLGRIVYPSLGVMVEFGRLFNLLVYIGAVYLIIKKIKFGKWTLLLIATLPIMIQQATSLSYDSINAIAVYAWFAYIVNLYSSKKLISKKEIIIGILLSILIAITKLNNLLLLALIFVIPKNKFAINMLVKKINDSRLKNYLWFGLCMLIIILITLVTYVGVQSILSGQEFDASRLVHVLLNTFIWGDGNNLALIDGTTVGIVGFFSNFYYHLPYWSVVITFVSLAFTMHYENFTSISKRFAFISTALFFASVLLISIGMYYAWATQPFRFGIGAPVTDGIQGRYFTPLLILLFPGLAYLRTKLTSRPSKSGLAQMVSVTTIVFILSMYLLLTWHFFWR